MATSSGLLHLTTGHLYQIAITSALVIYSLARNKLTPGGILAAILTALIHMCHPLSLCFNLLVIFFLSGTVATKVNHAQKATLTQSSTGGTGGEGPRNASQVLANSSVASALILIDLLFDEPWIHRTAIAGIVAAYAAAAADTLSSELGILSPTPPFLVTTFQRVPKGTNGGVTIAGLAAGFLGSSIIAGIAYLQYPKATVAFAISIAIFGLGGSILDSVLGAVCQMTVEDKSSGRVIEGANGRRVPVKIGGSRVQRGKDVLNNNGVNFAMTLVIAVAAMTIIPSLI